MHSILFIVVLSILSLQYANGATVEPIHDINEPIRVPEGPERDGRGISAVWQNVKNSAKNAWNSIKNIAQKTKEKIKHWIGNVKEQARKVTVKLEDKIRIVQEKSRSVLKKLVGTGQHVKECFHKENENIENLLKQIIEYVTSCISSNLITLDSLHKHQLRLELNETDLMNDVENKMNKCVSDINMDECLLKVTQETYSAMENKENEVLATRTEARGIADDLVDAIATCSIEGLIDASNVIASESIKIISCVIKD